MYDNIKATCNIYFLIDQVWQSKLFLWPKLLCIML